MKSDFKSKSIFLGVILAAVLGFASFAQAKPKKTSKPAVKQADISPQVRVEKTETPAPETLPVKFNGFIQAWAQWTENGPLDLRMAHARLKVTATFDPKTSMIILPEFAPTGFVLLDAYGLRVLDDDWSILVGQFKPAFGDDRYLTPIQLKRVNYVKMHSFVFPGNTNSWDIGVEIKRVSENFIFQADLIQGAGPNKTVDNDAIKDIAGRFEWKNEDIALGASYYGGTNNGAGYTTYQNWLGLHARFNSEEFDVRAEAVFSPFNRNAFFAQAAYRTGDFEPLAWGEIGLVGSVQNYQLLGLGINVWPSAKTRLSLNVTFNGVTDFTGPKVGILQAEQIF